MLGGKAERLGQARQDEGHVGQHGLADGHERIGDHSGRLASQGHTVLGVLDRAPGGSCEAGPGLVEAVHDQEGLRHAPPGELGSRSLEQS